MITCKATPFNQDFWKFLTCLDENIIRCGIWMLLFHLYFSALLVELYMNFSHKERDCSDTLAMFKEILLCTW